MQILMQYFPLETHKEMLGFCHAIWVVVEALAFGAILIGLITLMIMSIRNKF